MTSNCCRAWYRNGRKQTPLASRTPLGGVTPLGGGQDSHSPAPRALAPGSVEGGSSAAGRRRGRLGAQQGHSKGSAPRDPKHPRSLGRQEGRVPEGPGGKGGAPKALEFGKTFGLLSSCRTPLPRWVAPVPDLDVRWSPLAATSGCRTPTSAHTPFCSFSERTEAQSPEEKTQRGGWRGAAPGEPPGRPGRGPEAPSAAQQGLAPEACHGGAAAE